VNIFVCWYLGLHSQKTLTIFPTASQDMDNFEAESNFPNEKANEIDMVGDSVAPLLDLVHTVQRLAGVINTVVQDIKV